MYALHMNSLHFNVNVDDPNAVMYHANLKTNLSAIKGLG